MGSLHQLHVGTHLCDKPQGELSDSLLKNKPLIFAEGFPAKLLVFLQQGEEDVSVNEVHGSGMVHQLHECSTYRTGECSMWKSLVEGFDYEIVWFLPCTELQQERILRYSRRKFSVTASKRLLDQVVDLKTNLDVLAYRLEPS